MMIPLALQLYNAPGGDLLLSLNNATMCELDNGPYGFRSLTCFVPMVLAEAYIYYDQAPGKWAVLNFGAGVVWEGRVEDRNKVTGGLELVVFGEWQEMYDLPYTALWSKSGTAGWEKVTDSDQSAHSPEKYEMDNNNRLFVTLQKDEVYTNLDLGGWYYGMPDGGSRNDVIVSLDYDITLPNSSWQFAVRSYGEGFSGTTVEASVAGSGSQQTGSLIVAMTAGRPIVDLNLRFNAGGSYTNTDERGVWYMKVTNLRIVTSTTNQVNTTTTTTISAGSDRVVTPASMARIYVGQRLFIDSGSSPSESVVVKAVTATTFTADFANSYSGTTTIQAHVVYADEIVEDLVSHISSSSTSLLSSSPALIESPGLDLLDEAYEDAWPGDIAIKLAGLGDNQSPPWIWEVGVWENRRLHFRPRGSAGRSWAVDVPEHEVNSTLDNLRNSAYGVYADANGRVLRTEVADDAASQARYGIKRQLPVSVQTTSNAQASVIRDAALADGATIRPRSAITVDLLTNGDGAVYPKWLCRSGDTITIRNLPPTLSQEIDRIRTFVVAEVSYDWLLDNLQVTPEQPVASLEVLLARREEGF